MVSPQKVANYAEGLNMPLSNVRRLRISKAQKNDIKLWAEGVSLERDSGLSVDDLVRNAAVERWRLALLQLRQGRAALRAMRPSYRAAISRFYYAMYHAARAVVYLETTGDDHEEHRKLPAQLPTSLPSANGKDWQNRLKDAREIRNNADYDPVPVAARHWRRNALHLESEAAELVSVARRSLQAKGCSL